MAALLQVKSTLVDHLLYWIPCRSLEEAHHVLTIINSDAPQEAVMPLMSKGQFGERDLHKHLLKPPTPEFNPENPLHVTVSEAAGVAAQGAAQRLAQLRKERDRVTVTVPRGELRKLLRESPERSPAEEAVGASLEKKEGTPFPLSGEPLEDEPTLT